MASLVKPEQVIISNINPTHLNNFKNTRNIAIEKSDLFNPAYNANIKLLILPKNNKDEIFLYKIAKKYKIRSIITYGENSKLNYYIKKINRINNKISKITYATPTKIYNFKTSYILSKKATKLLVLQILKGNTWVETLS